MKRVSFRKVYGYRDPESNVVEIPPKSIYECMIQGGNARDDTPVDLEAIFRVCYEMRRIRERHLEQNGVAFPRWFMCGDDSVEVMPGLKLDYEDDDLEPITQSKIDRVFGLNKDDDRNTSLAQSANAIAVSMANAGRSQKDIDWFLEKVRLK